jgi:Mor family transcriptional regulator
MGEVMSELMKKIRHELQLSGVAGTTILRIEHSLMVWGGGERHYLPKRSETVREQVRALIGTGMPARTARWKVRP